jgi:drug/metabolite transporter (DMT)-like permease
MNILIGALFLGTPVRRNVLLGAMIGLVGISLVFLPELSGLTWRIAALWGCCSVWEGRSSSF